MNDEVFGHVAGAGSELGELFAALRTLRRAAGTFRSGERVTRNEPYPPWHLL